MTKIKQLTIGFDWRSELLFALQCMAAGAVLFMVWEICWGNV